MALDLAELRQAVAEHGPVVRIVVADARGSTPREAGAAMLVWQGGNRGTIGGGTLEYEAIAEAERLLNDPSPWRRAFRTVPLGPALGQCCGGSVSLLSEVFSATELRGMSALKPGGSFLRPVASGAPDPARVPLPARRAAAMGEMALSAGWLAEAVPDPRPPLWIFGAGHVARALVQVLGPSGLDITWVDIARDRFPPDVPDHASPLIAANPGDAVRHAPNTARHLVMTHSHALDLDICHRLLGRSFGAVGLIGSATKWARFQKRLGELGHDARLIGRIQCPIGDTGLGKTPYAIALGVAAQLLNDAKAPSSVAETRKERAS